MLFYGNHLNIVDDCLVYNLTSMKEGYAKLNYLIPPNYLGLFSGKDFDIAYANYILENDIVFRQFFEIIYLLYTNHDVYLIIDDQSEWSENLIESLLKLIQQRYGYNGIRINCFEDFLQISNSSFCQSFNSYYGIYNLDQDKERYTLSTEVDRLRNGGRPYGFAEEY